MQKEMERSLLAFNVVTYLTCVMLTWWPLLSLSMINYAQPQIKSDGENIISKMWWMNSGEILKKTCSLKMIMRHYQKKLIFPLNQKPRDKQNFQEHHHCSLCRAARLCWFARLVTLTITRWCGSRGTGPSLLGMSRWWWITQTLINHDPISDKTGQQNESPTQLGGDKPQDH